ncbi:MAG: type I-E CRISPR-associated protein Cas6/Cse3/CasE [Limnobacter sp.]|uniref:type I-E CRISPR-associated protein Cas6/Cse3/CasE n=1 Tax=Limnobacter sp. TaxID=2003368 RepID=UPI002736DB6B|nr:type I-E CRISPR-associated protein Cas6/Cse3/CasE [Limnobacter sp.]MDP3187980.1 type I-E CRISPR-associated protein Cas6/Cse3/CasE [Limnobacter sp.]
MSTFHTTLTLGAVHFKKLKITDPYSLHRVVYGLFDEKSKDGANGNRILYCDMGGDFGQRRIEILSGSAPDTSQVGQSSLCVKQITDRFFQYDTYMFRVTVNPIRRRESAEFPIIEKQEAITWFTQKATAWGFEVQPTGIEIDSMNPIHFEAKEKHIVTINQAKIRGALRVVDREKFIHSAKNGIGRGKSFGCGLLLLQPAV